jgi:hypothetical protein
MALVIFLLTVSLNVWAQSCPSTKSLNYLPVHDQDGMGTCASNTAALIMQYNLGLPKSPSFMQMSITHSGQGGNNHEDFFFTDDQGKERLFNWGAQICDVVKRASKSGFCDYDQMGFQFMGAMDPIDSQQTFLVSVSRFLDQKEGDIKALKTQLNDPAKRAEAERRLAYFFATPNSSCRIPPIEFIARRALSRLKVVWESYLVAPATTVQQTAARRLLATAFETNGEPKAEPLSYYIEFLNANIDLEKRLQIVEQSNTTATQLMGVNSEALFTNWWGLRNDIAINSLASTDLSNSYVSDWRAYAPCRRHETLKALDSFLAAPMCDVPLSDALSPQVATQAQQLVESLRLLANDQLDPQVGLVNLFAPACATQMVQRANDYSNNCDAKSIKSVENATAAKSTAIQEVCAGRAVALSVCTGFFKATTPIDSKFCDNDVPGVADHGRHAVTLIGHRPGPSGKRQFLIQNSWGNSCPFTQHEDSTYPAALVGLVECELSPGGLPTGRFWVEEDLLFNNTFSMSTYVP